jgi:ferric-chelate reductase
VSVSIVSTASRSLTQADNQRPRLAEQELIIRVREGMTRRIFDLGNSTAKDVKEASGQATYPKASVPIRAWTEGPCECKVISPVVLGILRLITRTSSSMIDGHQKYLGEDYNTLLLIAGGSGVSYTLSIALDLVRRARAMHLGSPDKSVNIATKRLSFVWVIKREEQIAWIDDHLDAMCTAAPLGFLHVAIYVTSMKRRALGNNEYPPGHEAVDGASNEGTPRKGGYALKAVKHTQVEVLPGRPDFDGIIQTEIQQSDRSE